MLFDLLAGLAGLIGAVSSSITDFGVGSLLVPLLSLRFGIKTAIAVTMVPHSVGRARRLWSLWSEIDWKLLRRFGLPNVLGSMVGAGVHVVVHGAIVRETFGVLLIVTGLMSLTGFIERHRMGDRGAWFAGLISGVLGGIAGSQGDVRSGTLLPFDVPKAQFIATATAISLIVDLVRAPFYFYAARETMWGLWPVMLTAVVGVLVGSFIGTRLRRHIPERKFRKTVGGVLVVVGLFMLCLVGAKADGGYLSFP